MADQLPPLPPGATFEAPPLPPGASFEPEIRRMPRTISGAMRRMREPGYTPPVEQYGDLGRQYADVAKATGAELGKLVTGAGELLPGAAGEAAARGTQYLTGVAEQAGARTPGAGPFAKAASVIAPIPGVAQYLKAAKNLPQLIRRGAGVGAGAGAATPTGSPDISEKILPTTLGTVIGGGIPTGIAATRAGKDIFATAMGRKVQAEAQPFQKEISGLYEKPLAQQEAERLAAARTVEKMERQPSVAAERAATRAYTPEQQEALLQAQVRKGVREKAAGRRFTSEEEARIAEEAAKQSEQAAELARASIPYLEMQLLSRPTMSAEEFGAQLRNVVRKMQSDDVTARAAGANFNGVISKFGETPVVNTNELVNRAKGLAEKTRNPQVRAMLKEIEEEAKTDGKNVLSVYSSDSLRKYMSKDILSKYFAQTGADKEVLKTLKELRSSLIRAMPQEYKEALGRFRTLSRPLDIVERQGALKRVVDIDPVSTAEKLTEAQVVGEIINKAKQGNPVFSRLLEKDPSLKDSARLYFTKDLFGKDVVPSTDSLRTWLRDNERPLKQLGLYDEFKDIRSARQAADLAIESTKLAETKAKKTFAEAKGKVAAAKSVSEESEKRLKEALKLSEFPKIPKREAPVQTFVGRREAADKLVRDYQKMVSDINQSQRAEDVVKISDKAIQDLYKKQLINIDQYNELNAKLQKIRGLDDAKNEARKIIAYGAGLLGIGFLGRQTAESIVGGK